MTIESRSVAGSDSVAGSGRDEYFELEPRTAPLERSVAELTWRGKRALSRVASRAASHKESYGAAVRDWRNQLYWGDNLQVMGHLLRAYRGAVELVYIDPPFDSNANYSKPIKRRGTRSASAFEEKQYGDVWSGASYLQFMFERLTVMRELLSPTGSLFLHCDWHRSAQLRCILDEVFGAENFKNEIVWHYYNKLQGNVSRFASNHDTILFYSKSEDYTFHRLRELREKPTKQIRRVWDKAQGSIVNAKDESGHIEYIESTHKTLDDVWRLPMLQPADRVEAVGYPTQKPEALLERIILAASNPGDLVFDAFMGSGTALTVATKLGRRCIGSDVNLGAIHAATRRLVSIAQRAAAGEPLAIKNGLPEGGYEAEAPRELYGGVDVFSVNDHELFRNEAEAQQRLLEAVGARPLSRGSGFHGELGHGAEARLVRVMPIHRPATQEDLEPIFRGLDTREHRRRTGGSESSLSVTLLCMGHEPGLAEALEAELRSRWPTETVGIDVELRDMRGRSGALVSPRSTEASIALDGGRLVISDFHPASLLAKMSHEATRGAWRELVDSVLIDFHYDGVVLRPTLSDVPERGELVAGTYEVPPDATRIRIKITDIVSDVFETNIARDP